MSKHPPGWAHAELGELGKWTGGGTPSKAEATYWDGDIPWVSPKDMKVERIRDAVDHITGDAVRSSATNTVPEGSVLVVTRSGILRHTLPVATTERAVALNQDLKALSPSLGVSPDYVAWSLRARASEILATCSKSGTTVSNIDTRKLLEFAIPIAPVPEQRRIVAAIEEQFSRLDAADSGISRANIRLDSLRRSALAAAFSTAAPVVPVADAAAIVSGQTPKGLVPSDSGPVPFFKVGDMNAAEGYEMAASRAYVSHELVQQFRLKVRPAGTVIFPKRGGAIATNKKRILRTPAVFDLNTMGLVPGPRLVPKYLLYWMETVDLNVLADGSNIPQINVPDIASLSLPLPEIGEQHRAVGEIEAHISVLDSTKRTVEAAQRRSALLRRSILDKAFRGELVPQDPSDEPASVLLERIRAERAAEHKPRRARRAGATPAS